MKHFKVLGSGCKNCDNTVALIRQEAQAAGTDVSVEKVTDMAAILSHGVMSTPGVVLNGELVHAGGIPSVEKVRTWLNE